MNKLKTIFQRKAFFLVLLPVFFIYSGYNELFGFLKPTFVAFNLAAIFLFWILVYFITLALLRNKAKASLFTFFTTAYFLLFGFLHDSLKQLLSSGIFFTSFTFLIPISFIAILIFLITLRKKNKETYPSLFLYLNLLMIALIISEIPNSIKRFKLDRSVHNMIDFRMSVASDYQPSNLADSAKPDIYFLVFDAMASTMSMKEKLNKDNSALDSFLLKENFYIANQARANYNWTIHSLSTTFNMMYLPDYIAPVMDDPKAYFWGANSMLNNSLSSILQKEGYTIHQYQPISFNNVDWPLDNYFHYMKDQHFFFKTFPGRIYRDIFWNYTSINNASIKNIQVNVKNGRYERHKRFVDTAFSLVKNSCSKTGNPKFIYGHFMVPHDPYVFKRNGELKKITIDQIGKREFEPDAYFEQVLYADKLIENLVPYIKKNNKPNTVIIVAGDHGFKDFKKIGYSTFNNLNAFYFPDGNYGLLYDSISSINTFRVVMNKYFNSKLPLLKDSGIIVSQMSNTIISSKMK